MSYAPLAKPTSNYPTRIAQKKAWREKEKRGRETVFSWFEDKDITSYSNYIKTLNLIYLITHKTNT